MTSKMNQEGPDYYVDRNLPQTGTLPWNLKGSWHVLDTRSPFWGYYGGKTIPVAGPYYDRAVAKRHMALLILRQAQIIYAPRGETYGPWEIIDTRTNDAVKNVRPKSNGYTEAHEMACPMNRDAIFKVENDPKLPIRRDDCGTLQYGQPTEVMASGMAWFDLEFQGRLLDGLR